MTSLAKLAAAAAAADTFNEKETDQLVKIKDSLYDKNLNTPTPEIFDENLRSCVPETNPQKIRDLKALWLRLYPQLLNLAEENQLETFTYSNLKERILLESAFCKLLPLQIPTFIKARDGSQDPVTGFQELDPNIIGIANQIKDKIKKLDRNTLISLQSDTVNKIKQIYAEVPAVSKEKLNFNRNVLAMIDKGISVFSVSPIKILLNITDLSGSQWQSRKIAEINKEIQKVKLTNRASAMPSPGKTTVTNDEINDQLLNLLQLEKSAVLGLLPIYNQISLLQAIPVSDTKYKDAQAQIPILQKQLSDAETTLTATSQEAKAVNPEDATYLQADGNTINSGWIVSKLGDNRPPYVVVLEPTKQDMVGKLNQNSDEVKDNMPAQVAPNAEHSSTLQTTP